MAGPELMETAEVGGRLRRKEKLTVEEYLSFLDCENQHDLTVDQLNQIIGIHGFRKLHRARKNVLMEAVATLEFLDPLRSTMEDNIHNVSSLAHMTVEEAIKDLDDLQWQECCIKSLDTLNAVNHEPSKIQFQTNDSPAPVITKKRRTKRKRSSKIVSASIANNIGNLDVVTAANIRIDGETWGVRSLLHSSALGSNNSKNSRPKLIPRRKNIDAMAAHSCSVYAGRGIGYNRTAHYSDIIDCSVLELCLY